MHRQHHPISNSNPPSPHSTSQDGGGLPKWGGFHLLSLPPPFSPSRRTPIRSTLLEYYNIGRTPGLAFWKHLSHVPRIPQREVRENPKSAISPPPPPPLPFLLFEMYPKKSSSSGCRPHCRQGWAGRAQPKNARRERREGVEISLALFDRILLSLSSAALPRPRFRHCTNFGTGLWMARLSLPKCIHPPAGGLGKGNNLFNIAATAVAAVACSRYLF